MCGCRRVDEVEGGTLYTVALFVDSNRLAADVMWFVLGGGFLH